mmetsp:Transcript_38248/g.63259  ORF Transcript_38248/g.63259 Transcript_38248/m.63259 type:complete len:321 (-) Transcript_38248:675-1637(-)
MPSADRYTCAVVQNLPHANRLIIISQIIDHFVVVICRVNLIFRLDWRLHRVDLLSGDEGFVRCQRTIDARPHIRIGVVIHHRWRRCIQAATAGVTALRGCCGRSSLHGRRLHRLFWRFWRWWAKLSCAWCVGGRYWRRGRCLGCVEAITCKVGEQRCPICTAPPLNRVGHKLRAQWRKENSIAMVPACHMHVAPLRATQQRHQVRRCRAKPGPCFAESVFPERRHRLNGRIEKRAHASCSAARAKARIRLLRCTDNNTPIDSRDDVAPFSEDRSLQCDAWSFSLGWYKREHLPLDWHAGHWQQLAHPTSRADKKCLYLPH